MELGRGEQCAGFDFTFADCERTTTLRKGGCNGNSVLSGNRADDLASPVAPLRNTLRNARPPVRRSVVSSTHLARVECDVPSAAVRRYYALMLELG